MKIQQEIIQMEEGKSFKFFSPSLRNYFYWHYHPEFELIYVEALHGIRHVGQHIGNFEGSDLILMGPNIPHLNFDYGIKTDYKQWVLQFGENLLENTHKIIEFSSIRDLLKRAQWGISFYGNTKSWVLEKLLKLPEQSTFYQFISLLEILKYLADSHEFHYLNDRDTSVQVFLKDKLRIGNIYNYIHTHYNQNPDVNYIASEVNLSPSAFCRYFKKQTKMTFTDFVNQYRINQAKTYLLEGKNITETCYQVGFESLSYFNRIFKKINGINPSQFKKNHLQNG